MGLEILDGAGKGLLKQKPRDATTMNYLGGSTAPCSATLQVPLEAPAGMYSMRVHVVDSTTKQTTMLERKIEVLPKGFGLVHVGTSVDPAASIPRSPVGVVGDSFYLNVSAVGFERDPKTKQPNIKASMRVLDDKGQPTSAVKMQGAARSDVPPDMAVVPMQFGITLNRAGQFTLELTATDALTGKTSKVLFPMRVLTP
jgi:hypothetical protein